MVEYHAIQGAQARLLNLKKLTDIYTKNFRSRLKNGMYRIHKTIF